MATTPRLTIPLLYDQQRSIYAIYNEGMYLLDMLVQGAVLDRDLTTPPGSPGDGDAYLIALSATGDWAGHDGELTIYHNSTWHFFEPTPGINVYLVDEDERIGYDGTEWLPLSEVLLGEFGKNNATTTGLTFGYRPGMVRADNVVNSVGAGTVMLTDDAINYIEVDSAGSVTTNTSAFTPGRVPLFRVTTESGEITLVEDARTWVSIGATSGGGGNSIPDFDEDDSTTTGITWGYKGGLLRKNNVVTIVGAGTLALTDDAVNYVEVNDAGAVSANTSGFTSGRVPLRQVTTSSGEITNSLDRRAWLQLPDSATYAALDVAQQWTAQQYYTPQVLTDETNISWDVGAKPSAKVTITDNRTISAPTNIQEGSKYTLRVIQDGTGSRTMTWNAVFDFGAAGAPDLSEVAGQMDILMFEGGASGKLHYLGIINGLTP